MTSGASASSVGIYGSNTNAFVLGKDEVIEIVLNNDDAGKHPFHLHGHNFQAVVRSDEDAGFYDADNHTAFPAMPMRRDTFMVRPNGNFVVRFKADNPGKSIDTKTGTSHNLTDVSQVSGCSTVTSNGTWTPVSWPP